GDVELGAVGAGQDAEGVVEAGGEQGAVRVAAGVGAGDGGDGPGGEVDFADGAVLAIRDVGDGAVGDDALGLVELGHGGGAEIRAGAGAIGGTAVGGLPGQRRDGVLGAGGVGLQGVAEIEAAQQPV